MISVFVENHIENMPQEFDPYIFFPDKTNLDKKQVKDNKNKITKSYNDG